MSATDAAAFLDALGERPKLQNSVEQDGLVEAAEAAGFDVEAADVEAALAARASEDLPDTAVDPDDVDRTSLTIYEPYTADCPCGWTCDCSY